jgi:hypothetical protein
MANIPDVNFNKIPNKGVKFNQAEYYESNFDKINQRIVPKVNELDDKVNIDIPSQLAETDQRIDLLVTTPVPTGEIIAEEIIDARDGEVSVGAKIRSVDAQLAEKAMIKVFDSIPNQTELPMGSFGFVLEPNPLEAYNLSFEVNNAISLIPLAWVKREIGLGTRIIQQRDAPTPVIDRLVKALYLQQTDGTDGVTNSISVTNGNVIPLDGTIGITLPDLKNFRFAVYPVSTVCYEGNGNYYYSGIKVSFRNKSVVELGVITAVFNYKLYPLAGSSIIDLGNYPFDKWSDVPWDLYATLKASTINIHEVHSIVLEPVALTRGSGTSSGFYIDAIRFK